MRKFRNSAIALVSAAAISLGGMTAVSAVEDDQSDNNPGVIEMISSNGSSIPAYGEDLDADEPGYGTDGFGSSRDDSGEGTPRWLTAWGKVFDVLTVGSVLGAVVFPIINFMKFNGIIK